MTLPTLLAVSSAWEAALATGLDGHPDVLVVRRCADLADLLAAAGAGLARAAVVSSDLDGLDADNLHRLRRSGVDAVVLLADPTMPDPHTATRVAAAGGAQVLPAGSDSDDVATVLLAAADGRPPGRTRGATAGTDLLGGVPVDPVPTMVSADPATVTWAPAAPAPVPVPSGPGLVGMDERADVGQWRLADEDLVVPPPGAPPPRRAGAAAPEPGPPTPSPSHDPVVAAVWGPAGAPGRTTVAITLASELAALGHSALLVDADSYASSVSAALGLLEEGSGLAAAVRAATAGRLDVARLASLAPALGPHLRVLTGLPTASRWHELRPAGLDVVWEAARQLARWTVVDCASPLESDEDVMFDTVAPSRNQATLSALQAADVVVAVGAADPIGLQRLVRGLHELADVVPGVPVRVVVTKVRASAVGGSPQRRVAEVLQRFSVASPPLLVPDDRPACDAALLAGLTLTEAAPASPARLALAGLAAEWTGLPSARGARGRRRAGAAP